MANTHHDIPVHEVLLLQGSDARRGLDDREVQRRRAAFGPNSLRAARGTGLGRRLLRQVGNPLVLVLIAAAILAGILGALVDAAVIAAVVVLNAVIGVVQESRAEAALAALTAMVRTTATVVRSGQTLTVDSADLVPGDVVLLAAGDRVPADIRVIEQAELAVDESALTGESLPVAKDEAVLPAGTAVSDRRNMAYSGTLVTRGDGRGVVVAIGEETELGEIHRLVGSTESVATPLTRRIAGFSRWLTVAILALAGLSFAVGVLRGEPLADMLTAAVALAVAVIPEGLPAVVTITLAIGVSRMARRGAIIRNLPVVETLGSATVVCSDKTGTLTQNRMIVVDEWIPSADARRAAMLAAGLCTQAEIGPGGPTGDPTEVALLRWALDRSLDQDAARAGHPRIGVLPFSSERGLMATAHAGVGGADDGSAMVLLKGAPERVLPLCADDAVRREAALWAEDRAREGHRVLATAAAPLPGAPARMPAEALAEVLASTSGVPLALTGLVAMQDPPRSAVPAAVRACRRAGIEVRMVTGDHAGTARSIARQVGILGAGEDAEGLVHARVAPGDKLALVEDLQDRGEVVAMTGDGVNDAPALRRADIGIAMGRDGTDVAVEAADMVLVDDDFATIEAAIEEGRGVFDNLVKYLVWALPTSFGQGLVILVAVLAGTALPILPAQVLWVNLTTAVALGLMLAFEVREPGIMARPPRPPGRSLLTGGLVWRIAFVSVLMLGAAWWMFTWELSQGADVAVARTAAVNVVIAVEIVYLLSCRTLTGPVRAVGWFSNRWIFVGIAAQVAAQIVLTYVPPFQVLFDTAALDLGAWARIAGIAVLAGVVITLEKRLARYAL